MANYFGLDIGNHSIKAIRVSDPNSPRPHLVGYAYGKTPGSIINVDDEVGQKTLSQSIRNIISSSNLAGIKQVVFAIPEAHVSKRFMTLPYASEEEIETAVTFEMKKWIPYPLDDARINKIIVGEKFQDGVRVVDVLGIAVRISYLDRYIETLEIAGLEPIAAETEGVSVVRTISRHINNSNFSYVVIDFGSVSTDVTVAFKDKLIYSDSIPYGSDSITKAVMQTFNIDYTRAEEYKKTYGIDPVNLNGRLANVIIPVLDLILDDVRKIIEYFKREISEIAPSKIFLTGETTRMPGLSEYVMQKLQINVEPINNLYFLGGNPNDLNLIKQNCPGFVVALGLALKTDI